MMNLDEMLEIAPAIKAILAAKFKEAVLKIDTDVLAKSITEEIAVDFLYTSLIQDDDVWDVIKKAFIIKVKEAMKL